MMPYTVVWHEQAIDELAAVWTASEQRQAVTECVARVDRMLQTDPGIKGVDFYGDRLLVVPPLALVYAVREQDRIVEILTVTKLRSRPQESS